MGGGIGVRARLGEVGHDALVHGGLDGPGGQGVHPDVAGRQLHGQGAHRPLDGCLRRRIGRHAGASAMGGDRGHQDQGGAGRHHPSPRRCAHQAEGAVHRRPEHRLDIGRLGQPRRQDQAHAGGVEDAVQGAGLARGLADQGRGRLGVGDVASLGQMAFSGKPADGLGELRLIAADADHAAATAGDQFGGGQADAGAGPRHQHRAAGHGVGGEGHR